MSPEHDDLALILFRVTKLEEGQSESRAEFRETLKALQTSINALAFVPLTLYMSERDAMRQQIDSLKEKLTETRDALHEDIEDARKMALGAFGLIASTIIGAIILFIIAAVR